MRSWNTAAVPGLQPDRSPLPLPSSSSTSIWPIRSSSYSSWYSMPSGPSTMAGSRAPPGLAPSTRVMSSPASSSMAAASAAATAAPAPPPLPPAAPANAPLAAAALAAVMPGPAPRLPGKLGRPGKDEPMPPRPKAADVHAAKPIAGVGQEVRWELRCEPKRAWQRQLAPAAGCCSTTQHRRHTHQARAGAKA
ncbi:hypothetical protein COO60DRAFT_411786 [Scenedesmus sp. NREL 46B-D3]|nr:hypothetical protein COO60DRAFT_411786 [Scenedesmus sp. NREL 46B-D3]